MKSEKYTYKNFLFLLPLLAMLSLLISNTQSFTQNFEKKDFRKSFVKSHKDVNITAVDFDENDILITENEAELELELDWFDFANNFSKAVVFDENTNKITSNSFQLNSKIKIPLYDLFCNWKLHI